MVRMLLGGSAQDLLLGSLAPMVRAIGLSLGPDGRGMLFDGGGRAGRAVSGVEIAREIADRQGPESIGPRMLKEMLVASDRELQDGSARLALMSAGAYAAAHQTADTATSRGALSDALTELRGEISDLLEREACEAPSEEELAVAAGARPALAERLAGLFREVGATGGIDVVSMRSPGLEAETFAGFVCDIMALSPRDLSAQPTILPDAHVAVANEIVSDFGRLVPVIEAFGSKGKSLLIAARGVEGEALAALERNRAAGTVSVVAVKPEDAGTRGAAVLGDLAVACGARLLGDATGETLAGLKPDMLGRADEVRFDGRRLILRVPRGGEQERAARLSEIEHEVARARHLSLDREHAERRKARLEGRWAEIRIGGRNAYETAEDLAAARAALASMRSAAAGGVVEGGGAALSRVAGRLQATRPNGITAIAATHAAAEGLRAIERQLRLNAGADPLTGAAAGPRHEGSRIADPLRLTQLLVDQALSFAASLLRVGAVVAR